MMYQFIDYIRFLFRLVGGSPAAIGHAGESAAIYALEKAGYKATPTKKKHCGDVTVHLRDNRKLNIEVKTARVSSQGKFLFCLTKWGQYGKPKTCHTDSDFVLLLCVSKDYMITPFLIPAVMLQGQNLVGISAKYVLDGGKYDKYRQPFSALNFQKSLDAAESN
jgi:hypothetical protein